MPILSFTSTLAVLLVAVSQATTAVPTKPATTTFHSDALHLDFTYASALTAMPGVADDAIKTEKDKATGVAKEAIGCVTMPLTAADEADGLRMVILMRLDGGCLGTPVTSSALTLLATSALTQSLARFGDPKMETANSYELADHSAATINGVVKSEKFGATFYGSASCVIQGSDAICWEFMSNTCPALSELIRYPVKFEGKAAEPVIPAKYTLDCK